MAPDPIAAFCVVGASGCSLPEGVASGQCVRDREGDVDNVGIGAHVLPVEQTFGAPGCARLDHGNCLSGVVAAE